MILLQVVLLFMIAFHSYQAQTYIYGESNFGLNVLQLAAKYGYPSQSHQVTTKDLYILQLERIPYGRKNTTSAKRSPVLLVPGLLSGSVTYACFGPERSLAFILADSGYDVWLLNFRGTTYSRKHVFYNPDVDKAKFWDFSFVEIGGYDVPAAIDHILKVTKQDSLFYIGHSLGAAGLFALLADRPDYNRYVKLMVAMAPVLQLNNTRYNVFTAIGVFEHEIQWYADLRQSYEILRNTPTIAQLGNIFCSNTSPFQTMCTSIIYSIAGYSSDLDTSQLPVIISTNPAGASLKTILHSSQLYRTGRFAKYDYGPDGNLKHYGKLLPPLYHVNQVTAPVAIFYGENDVLVSEADIDDDIRMLPNVLSKTLIKSFSHIDFTWGVHAPTLVYQKILDMMKPFK